MQKTCTKCGETKPVEDFPKAKTGTFGRRGDCKLCRRGYCKHWYDGLDASAKLARHSRPGKREWQAAYYRRNKDYFAERGRRWVAENADKHRASTREAMRRRRATAKGKLEGNVSRAVNRALRGRKNGEPAFQLLGFSVEELIAHLEKQFSGRMSWDNYGEWHVDHILPLASFQYEAPSDPDFKLAWALTNLRPLWATDNIRKGPRRHLLI